ncbi:Nudix hydrolase 15 protein [Thalictrum thalictroides]|uniref:Nudix hydrolase 15 protein n=1 Tax=Thalictrum thalictroides TaxID=46969 RepID=A0A7J6W301_THATH|nr:Nudix hydrolase 15 protein [Thalictrum thalictroides]
MDLTICSNNWYQQLILHNEESEVKSAESDNPKRAAVLVCLFEGDDGDLRVLLTKRCSRISYPGEVSLPGGKVEEGDRNDSDTAMREAKEEIGLEPSLVKIVTSLDPYMTKRLVSVTPVIGILSDKQAYKPTPNAEEVEEIFDAPLEMFLKKENQRSEEREWMGDKYLLHFFDYETENKKYVIWGLTSWILIQVASIVYQRSPDFVEQKPNYKLRSLLARKAN